MDRVKADSEFYASLDYDRTRYTEDIAVDARLFLVAVRNALLSDPIDTDLLPFANTDANMKEEDSEDKSSPSGLVGSRGDRTGPGRTTGPAGSGNAARGTKRKTAADGGRGATTSKAKKPKRGTSTQNCKSNNDSTDSGKSTGSDRSNSNRSSAKKAAPSTAAPTSTIGARSEVACRVKEDGKATWILGRVIRYVSEAKKYEVMDCGDDEKKKTHMVFKKYIRVLPKKPLDFAKGSRVHAVYPDTTVFYPATISGRRGRQALCMFDDEEEDEENQAKEVNARFVIEFQAP